ncbi:DUF2333 family protein [Magnetospirillum molischianum]|uniref:DUF2333 domain-containing protein n=1 Tax=Magnetospirillum molischianum DSM 120 TaxID=1150626 RepID=H8FMM3_MAGML|nr:DUF2333 family protein [Magnetospirillum molischianum]CCG39611.1 conserved hypothetical protein [Magnetospirillum molischianum DSM 120]
MDTTFSNGKMSSVFWFIVASDKAKIALAVLVAFFFLIFFSYRIDDDPNLKPNPKFVVEGGSAAVTMAATLMNLEINETGWAPNKPWIYPMAHSSNMKAYQTGIQYAVARWANEMSDFLGRERGSGEADRDLISAKGKFSEDPTEYILPSSVAIYNEGIESLVEYNHRLAHGEAKYDKIHSSLADFLVKISRDLGSQSAAVEALVEPPGRAASEHSGGEVKRHITEYIPGGSIFDSRPSRTFFATKGRMYAYYTILKGVGEDYKDIIASKGAQRHWNNMLSSLRDGATMYKTFITNGTPGSYVVPSDIATQGFFLMRADKQILEVADILSR